MNCRPSHAAEDELKQKGYTEHMVCTVCAYNFSVLIQPSTFYSCCLTTNLSKENDIFSRVLPGKVHHIQLHTRCVKINCKIPEKPYSRAATRTLEASKPWSQVLHIANTCIIKPMRL